MSDDTIAFFDAFFKGGDDLLVPVFLKGEGLNRTLFIPVSDWARELPEIIAEHPTFNVFYGLGLLHRKPASGRGLASDLGMIGGVYFDIDMPQDDGSKYAAQTSLRLTPDSVRMAFEEIGLTLSAITATGGGFHAYLRFSAPIIFRTDLDRERVADIWKRLTEYVRAQLMPRGWRIDFVADLMRLDRAIGSFNQKTDRQPQVTLEWFDPGTAYSLDELEARLPRVESKPLVKEPYAATADDTPEALANFDAIFAADEWVRHCVMDAETLREPEWFAFMLVLAHCANGEALAHRFSAPHPKYSEQETAEKFRRARESKPPTYDFIRSILDHEPGEAFGLYGTAKSPITFGYMDPELARIISRYAFVVGEDRFVRLDTFEVRSKKAFDAENLHLLKSPSYAYLSSPLAIKVARRDYLPGQPRLVTESDGSLSLNAYRRPVVAMNDMDWPIIRQHFETLFPHEEDREAILDRFAMAVQQPGQKVKSAVLIFGPEGGGKGTLIELLTKLVGRENVVTLPSSAVDDPFQDDRVNKQLVVFNEVSGIRKAALNSLKELVTEPMMMVQGKGVPRFSGRTPSQVWITTNDDAALQLNAGDRRYLVFRTPDVPPETTYFDRLYEAIPDEMPGFAYAMATRDLSGFNPNARPQVTAAKEQMIQNAASDLEYAIREAMGAEIGVFAKDFGSAEEVIRAVMANGWTGRPLHAKGVGAVLTTMGTAKMERVTLPNGTKPYFHAWRNKDHWLQAEKSAVLAHRGALAATGVVVQLHPQMKAIDDEAEQAISRLAC